jgi:glycosyltransferase involved in cell wall biosynthesis
MRILAVTNLYPSPFHPQRATFNREQFRALAREHELRVIAPIAWTEELAARRSGCPPLPPGRRLDVDGIPVEYPRFLLIPRVLRGLQGRCFRWSIRAAFWRCVRSFRPDVVFATWAYPDGWAVVDLARQARLPVVLKIHGSDVLQMDQYPGRRRGTIEALRRADRVVAVSRDLANTVIARGADPAQVHVIYNGVDGGVFHPGDQQASRQRLRLDSTRDILLYIGNLVAVKGPDILIDACSRLSRIDFDVHMIGQGSLRSVLEADASKRGISGRVTFHGPVAHDRLPDWFRAADLLVLPSRSEGVPNVLLEATACGTPFVAFDVGGVAEVAHFGNGRLVPQSEGAGALAEAIQDVLSHPPPRTMTQRVLRTHTVAVQELISIFKELLGEESREDPSAPS